MTNKLIYFLCLGIFLSILACSKDDTDVGTDPDPEPEEPVCVLQSVYRDGALIGKYEKLSDTKTKRDYYSSEDGTLFRTIITEKHTDGRFKNRTFSDDERGDYLYVDYIHIGNNPLPDTVKAWSIEDGVYQDPTFTLYFYEGDDCSYTRVEYYDSSKIMYAFKEREYTQENCGVKSTSYNVDENGEETISFENEYTYDSNKNIYATFSNHTDSPHNITFAKYVYQGYEDTEDYTYEYNEEGYPTSQTITTSWGTTTLTFEYICE